MHFPKATTSRTKPCLHCSSLLSPRKPSRLALNKFCSKRCEFAYKVAHNPRRSQPCPVCGGTVDPNKPTNTAKITCSPKCGYIYRKTRLRRQRPCGVCGVLYWPGGLACGQKFCSLHCYRIHQHKRLAMVEAECGFCSKKFRRTIAAIKRVRRSFCSSACSRRFYTGERNHFFRGDKDPNRGAEWNRLAESIRQRDAYQCQRCNISQEEHGQKLSVDHIRPWRLFTDKSAANDPLNLISLCRRCHAWKTATAERLMLRGDTIAFEQYRRSIAMSSQVRTNA